MLLVFSENQAGKIPEAKRVMIFCFNRKLLVSRDLVAFYISHSVMAE